MKTLKTALVATAAATAMAVSATPAMANDRDYKRGGLSAGEVIAGAVVLGGLAAILTSGKKDRYSNGYRYNRDSRYDNRRYNRGDHYRHNDHRYGYRQRISPRKAVRKCVRAAERRASHYGRADVTDVRKVKRTKYGYKIKGRIAVRDNYRSNRGRYYQSRYDRGYRHSNYDTGKFTCYVEGRRVSDVRIRGLNR